MGSDNEYCRESGDHEEKMCIIMSTNIGDNVNNVIVISV